MYSVIILFLGSTEGIGTIEGIMEGIATAVSLDPVKVRLANINTENSHLLDMVDYWMKKIEYEDRLKSIEEFNEVDTF